jgi:hypothetical protein
VVLPVVLHRFFSTSIITSIGIGFFTVIWSGIIIFIVGLNKNEKQMVISKIPFIRDHFPKAKEGRANDA